MRQRQEGSLSSVQGQPGLHDEFQDSQHYMVRLCQSINQEKEEEENKEREEEEEKEETTDLLITRYFCFMFVF